MNQVRIQFLGSGDAFGSGGRFQTCLHLSGPGEPVLIDCGASSLIALKRAGLEPSEIGCVGLTHLHGDHFGGLPFLILDGQFSRRTRSLVIGGPPGVRDRVEARIGKVSVERGLSTRFAFSEVQIAIVPQIRKRVVPMTAKRRIGILTGGGDVPGLNVAIKAVVSRAKDGDIEVVGLRRGWLSVVEINPDDPKAPAEWTMPLTHDSVRTIDRTAGTIRHTSRINPAKVKPDEVPASVRADDRA